MKTGSLVRTPRAVEFSSSSSPSSSALLDDVSSDAKEAGTGLMPSELILGSIASLELVMMRSDSLSLSSYSSWLLPAALRLRIGAPGGSGPFRLDRRLRRPCWSKRSRRAFGSVSSAAAEDKEEEEGWEDISIQDSE